jgi:hypothetical protein
MTEPLSDVLTLLERIAREHHGLLQGLQRHRIEEQQAHAGEFATCAHADCVAVLALVQERRP